jgi:hypothetical protein
MLCGHTAAINWQGNRPDSAQLTPPGAGTAASDPRILRMSPSSSANARGELPEGEQREPGSTRRRG